MSDEARGVWLDQAFDWLNATLFERALPRPLIVVALTPYGGCLAHTRTRADTSRPPTIVLHPSLWGGRERKDPWDIPPEYLGARYALDVLLHECIHVSVEYRLGGRSGGTSSHNNPEWVAEVNRLAPLLGLAGVHATMSKTVRDGKTVRRIRLAPEVSAFPHAVRRARGELDYYRDASPLPFERDTSLRVTG